MTLIDTHCHLYSKEFENDIDEVIARAEAIGVRQFFLPAIDSESLTAMLSLEERYPGKCIAMIGLHPCSIKGNYKDELTVVESNLQKRKFAAIGEIGLDFYWDTSFSAQQYDAFRLQIDWALQYKLPVVIHSRNAMKQTIDVINEYKDRGLSGIFHCFSGNIEEAAAIISAGFYLGIGGVITYKNSGLAEVVSKIGLDHLVLETDAPYLAPVPFRGKKNESSYLQYIIQKIVDVTAASPEQVAAITTDNAQKIFGY